MKTKKLGKKLALSKTTIANLEEKEQSTVKGGYWATAINTGCTTWHPICPSQPQWKCPYPISIEICPVSDDLCETIFC